MLKATSQPKSLAVRSSGVVRQSISWLWGLAADALVFLVSVWWCGLYIITTLVTGSAGAADFVGRQWSRWVLAICGIRVEVDGLEHVDRRRSYVIASNHLSNFDVWAIIASLPFQVRFVAKRELLKIPIFGQALARSDHIIIDRARPEAAIARINAQVAAHRDRGICIVFFAEGTRSPDGKVHAFKKGGAALAVRAGLPILPLSISGTRKFLPRNTVIIRPGGRVKIVLAPPIDSRGYELEQSDALTERVRDAVVKNYVEDY